MSRTSPACGRWSPRIERSNTDLPDPEPPTMPNTSPRSTVMSRPSCTICAPKRFTSPRTSRMASLMARGSYVELPEHDREQRVREDDEEDGLHDRNGREPPELPRGIPHLQAAIRARQRDQQAEERRLDDADPECRRGDRVLHAIDVQRQRHVEQPLAEQ